METDLFQGEYKLVQTPQIFSYKIITESYNLTFNENFTDDASVVEACGYPIYLTEGNRENIKVTTPIDMAIGESLLRKINESTDSQPSILI